VSGPRHSLFWHVALDRISYWLGVPTATCDDLEHLRTPQPSGPAPAPASLGGKSSQPQHPPPAIEVGIDASGRLTVVHTPVLRRPTAGGQLSGEVELGVDWRTLSVEDVLRRAAEANAAVQLGKVLVRSAGVTSLKAAYWPMRVLGMLMP
jgi:hypothetical protein